MKTEKYIIANEEDGANIWGLTMFPQVFSYLMPKYPKTKQLKCLVDLKGQHFRLIVPDAYWQKVAGEIMSVLLKKPDLFSKYLKKVQKSSKKIYNFSNNLSKIDPKTLSAEELVKIFNEHFKLVGEMTAYGMVSTVVEIAYGLFTKYLNELIQVKVVKLKLNKQPGQFFSELSALNFDSASKKEYLDLLNILHFLEKNKLSTNLKTIKNLFNLFNTNKGFNSKIKEHILNYGWVNYNYNGPSLNIQKVLNELIKLYIDKVDAKNEIKKIAIEKLSVEKSFKKNLNILKFSRKEKLLFSSLRDAMKTKIIRRDALTFSICKLESFLTEFGKRTGLNLEQVRGIVPGEHGYVLKNKDYIKSELEQRSKYFVYDCRGKNPKSFSGIRAEKYISEIYKEQTISNILEIKGQVACSGFVVGKVKIINLPSDMKKMQRGDVLVSIATMPEIVTAMKKAGAIVTEQGGITSHAAIVSRELKIPCVIGTKIATKVFKDGDLVEVDANKGVVRRLK